jgi:hypothetical protein
MGRMETKDTVVGQLSVGDARFDYTSLFVKWFDHWLKNEITDVAQRSKIQSYLLGKNEWRFYDQWPIEGESDLVLYLDSNGDANSALGDGRLVLYPVTKNGFDSFVYDPSRPVPTRGGSICCTDIDGLVGGSFDQSSIEMRRDVLVYTSEPLEKGLNVTGTVEVQLFISSTAPDTDVTVKLLDVWPDGRAFNLDDTIHRMRFRNGFEEEELMQPGAVYSVYPGPLVTSNFFKKGHRIRIEISSSNFPRYGRNLNTGGNGFDEVEWEIAHNSVHHARTYQSRIILPIVPD